MIGDTHARIDRSWFALAALLWIFCAGATEAPSRPWSLGHYQHTTWTAKDGAPSEVYCLAQTSDGYIWVGGNTGLYRFDGARFVTFAPAAGEHLLSDQISSLLAVPSGGLWIGYEDEGISFLKDGHLVHYGAKSGFSSGNVFQIVRDKYGDVWADSINGLMRFHNGTWSHMGKDNGLPGDHPRALLIDRNGWLWLALAGRIFSYDHDAARFQDAGVYLPKGQFFFMSQAPDGSFFLAGSTKIILHFTQSGRHLIQDETTIPLDSAAMGFDRHGGMWVATLGDGIYRFADVKHALQADAPVDVTNAEHFRKIDGLSADYVWPTLKDREGNFWFGTQRGLDSFQESTFSAVPLPDGIHDVAIARGANGSMWVGSSNKPVLHVNDLSIVTTSVPEYALGMQQSSADGSVLAATPTGIWKIDPTGAAKELSPVPSKYTGRLIRFIVRDDRGQVWTSAYMYNAGLLRLNDKGWNFMPNVPAVTALFSDSNGTVWAGVKNEQLSAFRGDVSTTYGAIDGLKVGTVRIMAEHSRHLWVVGEEGIAYLKNGRFFEIHLDGDTKLRNVTGLIFSDDGSMWVHSVLGILHASPIEVARVENDSAHAMKYQLFDESDGIPGTPSHDIPLPSAAMGTDGRLWFASTSDVVWLDPREIIHNDIPPPVVIESLIVNGSMIDPRAYQTLTSATKTIDIAYTAPSFVSPRKVKFRYRLDGFDTHWSDTKSVRQVSYSNLSPGLYTFRVIASNNDGVWNTQGASITFSIAPSFFQTWWFRLLCAIAFLVALFSFTRWRITAAANRLRARLEIRGRERTRIANDIHDTLLQTVQALLIQVHLAARAIPASEPARHMLETSAEIANLAVTEGRDRIVSLQSFGGQRRNLSTAFELIGRHLEAIHHKKFSIATVGNCPNLSYSLGDEIIDIGREAMRNAFRHSEGKTVALVLTYTAHEIKIMVIDDGKGIDPAILASGGIPGHWGLRSIRDRADNIDATVCWSEGHPGTHFEFRISYRLTVGMIIANPIKSWRRRHRLILPLLFGQPAKQRWPTRTAPG